MTPQETTLLILAGGRATRLAHLADNCPKYLQPIAEKQVFADLHLGWAAKNGFRNVILSIGYLGDQIRQYCGDGRRYGLNIAYLVDGYVDKQNGKIGGDPQLIGTGGAIKAALKFSFEVLAVTYGDTILSFNLNDFLNRFVESGLGAGMTLYKNTVQGHVCNADLQGDKAIYNKRNPRPDWSYIDYGFLILRRNVIANFGTQSPLDLAEPLGALSAKSEVFGFPVGNRFWEIGSPEALAELQMAFKGDFKTF